MGTMAAWAKESRDLVLSLVASFSQTLAVFFSKDLWAGSIRKFVIYRLLNQLSMTQLSDSLFQGTDGVRSQKGMTIHQEKS